jgi:hypothetical protein
VTREQLEHAIRAACDVARDTELWVFGSPIPHDVFWPYRPDLEITAAIVPHYGTPGGVLPRVADARVDGPESA